MSNLTITNVQIYTPDTYIENGVIKISGETKNFETLGQQIIILKEEAAINKVNLEKISITKEAKISFDLSLSFNHDILR